MRSWKLTAKPRLLRDEIPPLMRRKGEKRNILWDSSSLEMKAPQVIFDSEEK